MNWTTAAMMITGAEDAEVANWVLTECTCFPEGTDVEIVEDLHRVAADFLEGCPVELYRARVGRMVDEIAEEHYARYGAVL